jgi:ribosome-binding factor A
MSNRRRVFQIAERIHAVLATELQRLADPRFFLVTITSVMVTADLRTARVYWVVTGDKERIPELEEAFETALGVFKRVLGKSLGIRFVPELRFFYDDTYDVQDEVSMLMNRLRAEDMARAGHPIAAGGQEEGLDHESSDSGDESE